MKLVNYFGGWVEGPSKQTDRTDGGWVQSNFGAKAEQIKVLCSTGNKTGLQPVSRPVELVHYF